VELPAKLHLDNTFALLRLVDSGAGWTITSRYVSIRSASTGCYRVISSPNCAITCPRSPSRCGWADQIATVAGRFSITIDFSDNAAFGGIDRDCLSTRTAISILRWSVVTV